MVALTGSSSTLNELIRVVSLDNARRQDQMDTEGFDRGRKIDVSVNLSHKSTGIHES